MKPRLLLWGVASGTALTLAGILRIIYARKEWEDTTFHPNWEMDTPGPFVAVGLLIIILSLFMGLVDWVLARRKRYAKTF